MKPLTLYISKNGVFLQYEHETINGYVFRLQNKKVDVSYPKMKELTQVTNLTHPNMLKIIEQPNNMVTIHFAFKNRAECSRFADELIDNKEVDVDEIRINEKTGTAVIIGEKGDAFNENCIVNRKMKQYENDSVGKSN